MRELGGRIDERKLSSRRRLLLIVPDVVESSVSETGRLDHSIEESVEGSGNWVYFPTATEEEPGWDVGDGGRQVGKGECGHWDVQVGKLLLD